MDKDNLRFLIKYINQIGTNISYIDNLDVYNSTLQTEVPLDNIDNISHIIWEHNMLLFCLIFPHEGNDHHFVLRINPKQTFDRWGNADLEEYYDIDAIMDIYRDLSCDDWIYRVLLEMYVDRYLES